MILSWRIGMHGLHVYEGDRLVAIFHKLADARRAVLAYNAWAAAQNRPSCATQARSVPSIPETAEVPDSE